MSSKKKNNNLEDSEEDSDDDEEDDTSEEDSEEDNGRESVKEKKSKKKKNRRNQKTSFRGSGYGIRRAGRILFEWCGWILSKTLIYIIIVGCCWGLFAWIQGGVLYNNHIYTFKNYTFQVVSMTASIQSSTNVSCSLPSKPKKLKKGVHMKGGKTFCKKMKGSKKWKGWWDCSFRFKEVEMRPADLCQEECGR